MTLLAVGISVAASPGGTAYADAVVLNDRYVANADASVFCDRANQTITLTNVIASVMWVEPSYQAGPYDNGQWASYDVFLSVDNGDWVPKYSWSNWSFVNGVIVNPDTDVHVFPSTPLMPGSGLSFSGLQGHTYRLAVQVAWYAGSNIPIATVMPTYLQMQSGYRMAPSGCAF